MVEDGLKDLKQMNIEELQYETRLRANIVEKLKLNANFHKNSWDRRKANERLSLARENLRDALNEMSLRQN